MMQIMFPDFRFASEAFLVLRQPSASVHIVFFSKPPQP